jgi:hypothetical protein
LPLEDAAERSIDDFLHGGWSKLHLAARDARPQFTDLARSFDSSFEARDLKSFEIAPGRLAWWPSYVVLNSEENRSNSLAL